MKQPGNSIEVADIVRQAVERYLEDFDHSGSQLEGELRRLRRIRVGNYRVVYEVLESELIVLVVKRRREV